MRFIDHRNGTVTDTKTGLMWLKNAREVEAMPWNRAVEWVKSLIYREYSDWRLPTVKELKSLTSTKEWVCALPKNHPFQNVQVWCYWSSCQDDLSKSFAYTVNVYYGTTGNYLKSDTNFVWPVRGGREESDDDIKKLWMENAELRKRIPYAWMDEK